MKERPIQPVQPPRIPAAGHWLRALFVLGALALWCWLPYRFLVRLLEGLAFSGSVWPFTDAYWAIRTAVWVGGLGLLVNCVSNRTKDLWLPAVAIASCWIIVLGGAINLAIYGYLIGQGVGLEVLPNMLMMLVGGLGLVIAGQRFLGWLILVGFASLANVVMAACCCNPASGARADGLDAMGCASAAAMLLGLTWEFYHWRRTLAPKCPRLCQNLLAAMLITAAAIQIAPVLAHLTLAHYPPWAPRYWTVGRHITWEDDRNDEIMATRSGDPLAWYIHAAPSAGGAGNAALAKCWVLAGPHRGKLADYAGVRLVEEGVYPAAVEQARRELGLD